VAKTPGIPSNPWASTSRRSASSTRKIAALPHPAGRLKIVVSRVRIPVSPYARNPAPTAHRHPSSSASPGIRPAPSPTSHRSWDASTPPGARGRSCPRACARGELPSDYGRARELEDLLSPDELTLRFTPLGFATGSLVMRPEGSLRHLQESIGAAHLADEVPEDVRQSLTDCASCTCMECRTTTYSHWPRICFISWGNVPRALCELLRLKSADSGKRCTGHTAGVLCSI
jgi:hypothetical protein